MNRQKETNVDRITIGFAGHTNAGKTTLVRTLAKKSFGQIEDKANTTKHVEPLPYEAIHATFLDCPGFQNAGLCQLYLDHYKDIIEKDEQKKNTVLAQIGYDLIALEAIENSDVILYVVNLEIVPDAGYSAEISLIQNKQPNIICILNKYGSQVKIHGKRNLDSRIEQWKSMLTSNGMKKIIVFDAHWDSPRAVEQIYQNISSLLTGEKLRTFTNGLNQFIEEQQSIKQTASQYLARCILNCRQIIETRKSEDFNYNNEKASTSAKEALASKVENEISKFSEELAQYFILVTQDPSLITEDFDYRSDMSKNSMETVKNVSVGGGAGTTIGAAIGGALGFVFGGGVGAGPAAAAGGAIGGLVGSYFGYAQDTNTDVKIQLTDKGLEFLGDRCIAIIWAMSHHGFGLGPTITDVQIRELTQRIDSIKKEHLFPKYSAIGFGQKKNETYQDKLIKWSLEMIQELEELPHLSSIG